MKLVTLALNPLEPESWKTYEVDNLCNFLMQEFSVWPSSARIYHNQVSTSADVTPSCEKDIENLNNLEGNFYVVVYPEGMDPFTLAIIAIVALVAVVVLMPQPPTPTLRNTQSTSPNNELSDRVNKPRPNARIPDIFGTVRSTPDLLAVPYKVFINNEEVEYSYMCIGRGEYDIPANQIKDDTTLASDIAGVSVEVFAPYTSPNSGDTPQLRIGTPISEHVVSAVRSNAVNGQVLRPPNDQNYVGNSDIRFSSPNEIQLSPTSENDFTNQFAAGDILLVANAIVNEGGTPYDMSGTYEILSVSDTVITLSSPNLVNANWDLITTTDYGSPTLSTSGPKWIGPFVLDGTDRTRILSNFVALNGLYKDNGKNQYRFDVVCEIEVTPINPDGSPSGPVETYQTTIEGSDVFRGTRASTLDVTTTATGRCKVRARRVTESDLEFNGTIVDEIKWRDIYSVSPVADLHFGNITTVHAVTYATTGALAIKERKLNMLVTRKLPRRISGSTFTTTLYPTNDPAEIASAICLDPYIGNRQVSEIDFDSIYDSISDANTYFGTEKATEFCYTFDSNNLSFEETLKTVADAAFCTAYRRGNIIKFSFEKETDNSTLLFNHRNKLPGSETRTISFGNQENYDGVSFKYVSPEDDAQVTYYIPEDRSAINPREIESVGIRNKLQARTHAKRVWNRIRYQNILTEFTATQEADLLVNMDRILVADNTRTGTQDGEVLSQNVLELTLSQPVNLTVYPEYNIFLQLSDGSVDSIGITQGSAANKVILERAPLLPLALDDDLYARTTYIISGSTEVREKAFLVAEKESQGNFTSTVRAVNYDSRYYTNDYDYINGIIDEDGNELP